MNNNEVSGTAKSSFSSKLGFVLAAAGSAVGLGNIWRFPHLAAKYGGGIFLLVYLVLAITFGFALMKQNFPSEEKQGRALSEPTLKSTVNFHLLAGWRQQCRL